MNETLKGLYNYLLAHKNESLTEVGCVGTVEGVTTDNVSASSWREHVYECYG